MKPKKKRARRGGSKGRSNKVAPSNKASQKTSTTTPSATGKRGGARRKRSTFAPFSKHRHNELTDEQKAEQTTWYQAELKVTKLKVKRKDAALAKANARIAKLEVMHREAAATNPAPLPPDAAAVAAAGVADAVRAGKLDLGLVRGLVPAQRALNIIGGAGSLLLPELQPTSFHVNTGNDIPGHGQQGGGLSTAVFQLRLKSPRSQIPNLCEQGFKLLSPRK